MMPQWDLVSPGLWGFPTKVGRILEVVSGGGITKRNNLFGAFLHCLILTKSNQCKIQTTSITSNNHILSHHHTSVLCLGRSVGIHINWGLKAMGIYSQKQANMTMEKQPWMKMYFLLNTMMFHGHVSFRGIDMSSSMIDLSHLLPI